MQVLLAAPARRQNSSAQHGCQSSEGERSAVDLDMIETGSLPEDMRQLMTMLAEQAAWNVSLMLALTQVTQRDTRLAAPSRKCFSQHLCALH